VLHQVGFYLTYTMMHGSTKLKNNKKNPKISTLFSVVLVILQHKTCINMPDTEDLTCTM